MTEEEKARIDCWPEAKYGGGTVDLEGCAGRGCYWDPSPRPDVPDCHVSDRAPAGFGYQVLSNGVVLNETGARIELMRKAGPRSSQQMKNEIVIFEATYYDENLLNFKVGIITINLISFNVIDEFVLVQTL